MKAKTIYGEVEQKTIEVQEWLITPEIAREILKKNVSNRNMSTVKVKQYATDMKNGNWEQENPQNILIVATDGTLKDGQHRLTALIKADVSIWFKVYVEDSSNQIDKGKSRSFSDNAKMQGKSGRYTDTQSTGAARHLYLVLNGNTLSKTGVPDIEIEKILDNNPENWEIARSSVNIGKDRTSNGLRRAQCIAALYCASLAGIPTPMIERFCEVANSGLSKSESEFSAIIFAKNLEKMRKLKHANNFDEFNACQEALADFVAGKKRTVKYSGKKAIYFNLVKDKI